MTLVETIKEQLKKAMKERNQPALDVYRSTLSACTNELVSFGKTPHDTLTDEETLKVIMRIVKGRKDSIAQYEQAGRNDLVEEEKAQLAYLLAFLPEQMADEKILEIAKEKQSTLGITDKSKIGILVGAVMKDVAGKADGQTVKKVVEGLFE
jgi:uncharacterized protein YqeY